MSHILPGTWTYLRKSKMMLIVQHFPNQLYICFILEQTLVIFYLSDTIYEKERVINARVYVLLLKMDGSNKQ